MSGFGVTGNTKEDLRAGRDMETETDVKRQK